MLNLPVGDIMNDHPIQVRADTAVRTVAHLLLRYRINGVVVMDPASEGRLLGVFTIADLVDLMDTALSGGGQRMQALREAGARPVSQYVTSGEPLSLQVDDNAVKAVGLMHKKQAMTIPVFEGKKLVGVLGRHDIINVAFA